MKRIMYFGCSLLMPIVLAAAFSRPLMAQDDGSSYAEFLAEQDQARKAAMGEKFLADFQTSQYVDPVYRITVNIHYKANNWAKVMDLAGRLEQLDPTTKAENKEQFYSLAMGAAQNSNNTAQTIAFGEKVLSVSPENLNALITLATTIPGAAANDKTATDKAEEYASKGLKVLPSSNQFAEDQKAGLQGMLYSSLGIIAFNRQDYDRSVEEFALATKFAPTDGNSWYLLGFSYHQQFTELAKKANEASSEAVQLSKKRPPDRALIDEANGTAQAFTDASREKREQAMSALASSVNCGGPTQQPATQLLTKIWQAKNNGSSDGLQDYIKSKKPPQ